jgi:hypothetical protein
MSHTLARGGVIALVAAILAFIGGSLGLSTLWPVFLAAGVAFGVASVGVGTVAAYVIGAATAWISLALRAGVLPDLLASRALVAVIAIAVITVIAAVTHDQVPLWVALVGFAAYSALYEPIFADSPTRFLTDSPAALAELLLASAIGLVAGVVADLVVPAPAGDVPARIEGGVA